MKTTRAAALAEQLLDEDPQRRSQGGLAFAPLLAEAGNQAADLLIQPPHAKLLDAKSRSVHTVSIRRLHLMARTTGPDVHSKRTGRIFKMLRERLGVSQADLAAALGKERSVISKMESGRVRWTPDEIAIAARRLGVEVGQIHEVLHVEEPLQAAS